MKTTLLFLSALTLASSALASEAEGPSVLVGPRLGIINVPTPTVGAEAQLGGWIGLSFDYGLVPDIKLKSAKVSWTNWYAGARVFPFHGTFFLGALYGRRTFKASATDDASGLEATARANSDYVAPVLGWRAKHRGFGMGVDLGWQFVTHHSKRLSVPSGFDAGKQNDIENATDKIGTSGLPVLGLLQLQYLF
jgi:hypothetical protein